MSAIGGPTLMKKGTTMKTILATTRVLPLMLLFLCSCLSHEALRSKGDVAYKANDYVVAAKWYRKAADQGDAKAQNTLGAMYYHGLGVK